MLQVDKKIIFLNIIIGLSLFTMVTGCLHNNKNTLTAQILIM